MSESKGLPEGWAEAALRDAVTPRTERVSPHNHGHLPYIGLEHIKADVMRLVGMVPATTMKSASARFYPGDVLYGRLRPYLNKVFQPDFEGLCSAEFIVIPKSEVLASRFLQYRINAGDFVSFARQLNTGDRPRVDFDQIGGFRIKLPPLAEQHRIVEKIEELFSHLDAGVKALERAKANLKRYRASVLKSAVEGGLTEEWRKDHPQAEENAFLEANWRPLEEVIAMLGQGWSPKCRSEPATDDVEWAVIKTSAIQSMAFLPDRNKQLPETLAPRPELIVEPGDLLITRAGPRARAGVTCLVRHTRPRLILCDKAYRVRFNETRTFPAFVEVVLNSPTFMDRLDDLKTGISDSGVNLTQKKFVELLIPLPTLAEQEEIVALVEERLSQIDAADKTIDAELIRSKRLRQSILKQAFEGRLVPRDQEEAVALPRSMASGTRPGYPKMSLNDGAPPKLSGVLKGTRPAKPHQ